jgi:hypothetical protein
MVAALGSSPEWDALFDKTKRRCSDRAVELITDDIEPVQPDYPWISELC